MAAQRAVLRPAGQLVGQRVEAEEVLPGDAVRVARRQREVQRACPRRVVTVCDSASGGRKSRLTATVTVAGALRSRPSLTLNVNVSSARWPDSGSPGSRRR